MFKDKRTRTSLRERLAKPRNFLARGLAGLFSGGDLDESELDDIEDQLVLADVGVAAAEKLVQRLRDAHRQRGGPTGLAGVLRDEMLHILEPCDALFEPSGKPYVIAVVGVNGVGKTTTIAKMAHRFQEQGQRVVLAAADTFRAAAIEQLQEWGSRLSIPVVAHQHGGDPAAVAHDAFQSARARDADILLIDTAGRQHTQGELMSQLQKVMRVLSRLDAGAPHEVLQVLDAGTGQNALAQLRAFREAVGVNSVCLTKLDGTAKGGILFAIAEEFALPVRFLGVGEGVADLRPFEAAQFVDAILPDKVTA
ncbi:MAG: signal recognition particle-docking protein FtsY [Gammaproteobacteria bacterium]|nr:signal recognition particle-docking protein FtsY [Gammaproteobacteria bacterium]